jgi:two-component system OmpR family sensor kinase
VKRRLPLHGHGVHDIPHRWRGMRHYVRARLHRRLFWSMGFAIVASFGAAFLTLHAFSHDDWETRERAMVGFAVGRFADVWHDAERRQRLADEAVSSFGVRLRLESPKGEVLTRAGGSCERGWATLDVKSTASGEEPLGQVVICGPPKWGPSKLRFFGALFSGAFVLWMFSGLIARRIGKPLWQLVRVTQTIGAGDLSARARLGRHHDGEVGALAHSINDMAERIERQVKGQKELLAGVSHEIRTPLARLRVLTEMLRDRGADEKLLAHAELEVAEIDDLTGRLLASSRLDFDGFEPRPIDARDLAATALERCGLDVGLLEVQATNTNFEGDPTLLQRALANLLANAKTYGNGPTRLLIHEKPGLLFFSVEDAGPGFDPGDLARVFSPFVRGKNGSQPATPRDGTARGSSNGGDANGGGGAAVKATDVSASLGLGLHLVQRIARAHGGEAKAENLPEGGARVTFGVGR